MKRSIFQAILALALSAAVLAQKGAGNQSTGRIVFYLENAHFKVLNQKSVTYTQLYFYMERNQLTFTGDKEFKANYTVEVHFSDPGEPRNSVERTWSVTLDDHISAEDTAKAVPIIFENSFLVKPGKYSLVVNIRDDNDKGRTGTYTEAIEIPDYDQNDLFLSSMELASQAARGGNADEMFVKNGYTVFPNPSRFYGSNLPRLWFYLEVYNLQFDSKSSDNSYTAEFIVTDENGSVLKEYPAKSFAKGGTSGIIIHSINVISLQSGRYILMTRVTDNVSRKTAVSKKAFVVFREGESIYETQADDSFFRDLDEAGAVRAGNIVELIGKDAEKKIYGQLELEGKKKFLDRFWKDRDPSPGTKTNEALTDYYTRYEQANLRFTTPNFQGWKTETGRVMVIYGFPAQVEKHEFENDKRPYQIWYYLQLKDQSGQTIFVFADIDESGNLRMIHSTARGEYNNPNWQRDVAK